MLARSSRIMRSGKTQPELKAADTVEDLATEDLLMEIPGRRAVLLGTRNVPSAVKRAILKNAARAKSQQRVTR